MINVNKDVRHLLQAAGIGILAFTLLPAVAIAGTWWHLNQTLPETAVPQESEPAATFEFSKNLTAELIIPRLGVQIPIVWSESANEDDFQQDLERGASHYPDTALPGQVGNAVISAHSSNFPWKKGNFKYAFARLNDLVVNDEQIFVIYHDELGNSYQTEYRVTAKAVVKSDDQQLFLAGGDNQMTLVTCWPLGTHWRRLMIKTELI